MHASHWQLKTLKIGWCWKTVKTGQTISQDWVSWRVCVFNIFSYGLTPRVVPSFERLQRWFYHAVWDSAACCLVYTWLCWRTQFLLTVFHFGGGRRCWVHFCSEPFAPKRHRTSVDPPKVKSQNYAQNFPISLSVLFGT